MTDAIDAGAFRARAQRGVAAAMLTSLLALPAGAQPLTADEQQRVKLGVDLIKLGCGTGVQTEKTDVKANLDASFSLKKLPGVAAGGEVSFSKSEVQALAASLQQTISSDAAHLSEKQIDCMKPYVDVLFQIVVGRSVTPAPAPRPAPITMTLLARDTHPLDGFAFDADPKLPAGLAPGPILPGGGTARLVFQVSDPDQVAQIDKVSVAASLRPAGPTPSLAYSVDPLKQSGFGAARPRQFLVRIGAVPTPTVTYINAQNKSVPVAADNLLRKTDIAILELDSRAGLQEALDITIVPDRPGLYQFTFKAEATSGGKEYDLEAGPLYVVRR